MRNRKMTGGNRRLEIDPTLKGYLFLRVLRQAFLNIRACGVDEQRERKPLFPYPFHEPIATVRLREVGGVNSDFRLRKRLFEPLLQRGEFFLAPPRQKERVSLFCQKLGKRGTQSARRTRDARRPRARRRRPRRHGA